MAIPPEVDGTVRLVGGNGPEPTGRSSMELRRFFRAPLLLIAVAVLLLLFVLDYANSGSLTSR